MLPTTPSMTGTAVPGLRLSPSLLPLLQGPRVSFLLPGLLLLTPAFPASAGVSELRPLLPTAQGAWTGPASPPEAFPGEGRLGWPHPAGTHAVSRGNI